MRHVAPANRSTLGGSSQSPGAADDTVGPFNLTVDERRNTRLPHRTGKFREKAKTKDHLKTELSNMGVHFADNQNYSLKRLQELADENNIPKRQRVETVEGGWGGQAKGAFQICWERGKIDPARLAVYTLNGKKRTDGTMDESMSLKKILGECKDFREEKTHLQVLAEDYGYKVAFTPKFHAEMAGEGIEYSWGFAKGVYRRKPLKAKKRERASSDWWTNRSPAKS